MRAVSEYSPLWLLLVFTGHVWPRLNISVCSRRSPTARKIASTDGTQRRRGSEAEHDGTTSHDQHEGTKAQRRENRAERLFSGTQRQDGTTQRAMQAAPSSLAPLWLLFALYRSAMAATERLPSVWVITDSTKVDKNGQASETRRLRGRAGRHNEPRPHEGRRSTNLGALS